MPYPAQNSHVPIPDSWPNYSWGIISTPFSQANLVYQSSRHLLYASCIFCWLNGCSCLLEDLLSATGRWVGDWRGEEGWEGFPSCGKWNLTRAVPHRPILCPFGCSSHQFTAWDGEQPAGLSLCPCWKLAGGGWESWEPFVICNFSLFWDAVEISIMLSHKSTDLSLFPQRGFSHYLERVAYISQVRIPSG